jgi:hypothetical protein
MSAAIYYFSGTGNSLHIALELQQRMPTGTLLPMAQIKTQAETVGLVFPIHRYFCYGCFNACPEQAILIQDKYELKQGRYLYPDISPADLAKQKLASTIQTGNGQT